MLFQYFSDQVLFARNELMHMEIKKGLKIKTKEREDYFKRIDNLIQFIETNMEPDKEVFNSDIVRKTMTKVRMILRLNPFGILNLLIRSLIG